MEEQTDQEEIAFSVQCNANYVQAKIKSPQIIKKKIKKRKRKTSEKMISSDKA